MSCSGDSVSPFSCAVTAACISAVSALVAVPLATRPAMAASPLAPASAAFPPNICISAVTSMSVSPPAPLSCRAAVRIDGAVPPSCPGASTLACSQSKTWPPLRSLPPASCAGAGTPSPCSRLLASFDSNPEKPPPSLSDPPFRPALRDRSAVASAAAIGGCDTAPVFIACLPRSRFRPPARWPCALAPAPGPQPRLPGLPHGRLGIRRIGHAPHLPRNRQRRIEQGCVRLSQLAPLHRAQNLNAAIELLGDDQGCTLV